jgi:hypothetical protein
MVMERIYKKNELQIENSIKRDSYLRILKRTISINHTSQMELLSIEQDTIICGIYNRFSKEVYQRVYINRVYHDPTVIILLISRYLCIIHEIYSG